MRYGNSKEGMSTETPAKRNRARREKLRSAGLRPMQVWIRKADRPLVRAYVARLLISKRKRAPVEDDGEE